MKILSMRQRSSLRPLIWLAAIAHFVSCKPIPESTEELRVLESSLSVQKTDSIERTYSYLDRELEYLMNIWPGVYDNVEQLDFDKQAKKEGLKNGGHLRIHSHIARIDNDAFGENVIYLEEYQEDLPAKIYRQCIYSLTADESAQGIRIRQHHFVTPQSGLHERLDSVRRLTPDSKELIAGCDLLLKREGMALEGGPADIDCAKEEAYRVRIAENEYWFQGQPESMYQLEKARCFVCMIDFPREQGGRPIDTKHYVELHDQGGKFEFDYVDGRHMVLGMRNTWSFGMQRETFVIFIQEDSQKGKTLIYSWGNPGADRIGFNPGWIRVQCDLDTPKNRALQQALRPDS